jgi:hypothetical protein
MSHGKPERWLRRLSTLRKHYFHFVAVFFHIKKDSSLRTMSVGTGQASSDFVSLNIWHDTSQSARLDPTVSGTHYAISTSRSDRNRSVKLWCTRLSIVGPAAQVVESPNVPRPLSAVLRVIAHLVSSHGSPLLLIPAIISGHPGIAEKRHWH